MNYKIGLFNLDTSQNKLFKDGQRVRIGDKSFKLLALLVKHAPETVSKKLVMDEVWKGRVVTENTLYKTISRIRHELENAGLTIESVFSEGYRISDKVETIKPADISELKSSPASKKNTLNLGLKLFILMLFVLSAYFFFHHNKKPAMTLQQVFTEMDLAMGISKKAFISQINQRNELGKLLDKRFDSDPKLTWERKFFNYYDKMNEEEHFVFAQIRAYTEGPMLSSNQLILDLINNNKQVINEIPAANKLRNHLIIWVNKYHKVFKNTEKMCLLYVGVEDGAPYPREVDQQVKQWLKSHKTSTN